MKHLYQNWNEFKVLSFFFENPYQEVYLRELARALKMSASSVLRALNFLASEKMLVRSKRSNGVYFKANLTPLFKANKIAYTLSKIFSSKVIEKVEKKSAGLNCFLLFGSAAKGEDDKNSDYDLLLITSSTKISSGELAAKLGREVNLKIFNVAEWHDVKKKNNAFYNEVISNSVCLLGEKPVL
ncbi:MAG: nucleotidyltransferase domain-containing protein [Candidatus Micrarchaeota archaeon]